MDVVVFRAKVSPVLLALFTIIAVSAVLVTVATWYSTTSLSQCAAAVVGFGAPVVLGRCFSWPIDYILTARSLVIRSGLLRTELYYSDIVSVTDSSSIVIGFALSQDRIKLVHSKGETLIAPVDREEFKQALCLRAPHLNLETFAIFCATCITRCACYRSLHE